MSLSYGLNIIKKPPIDQRPPPAKRKTIFDDDSGPEDGPDYEDNHLESISTIGGLQKPSSSKPNPRPPTSTKSSTSQPPPTPKKPPKISQYGDLSTSHTTQKHSKSAQEIDPSIYDYDAAYDSLHAVPTTNPSDTKADTLKQPKYMSNLLAAADVRKRDALRAKEKLLQKEREAEGDEFKDKEAFVTGAYKRQQAEMRALEAEEQEREREAEERKRREGGGMRGLYKNLLERDEERHRGVMLAVEEGRGKKEEEGAKKEEQEKSEVEIAREKGVQVNEDGQIVDKRQLLGAGLNAGAAPKARPAADGRQRESRGRKPESARERESRMFEEQLLGKRSASPDDRDSRAAKSRKMEDELLAAMGSP
ncbi:MAG: hypothetical protein OHK93_008198 [Ramalina farinacea]|uniref:Nuclear speckle splicing regulatory protein 1 N-terminal domain-containing protein n=1 Tax=Ramalina farinacea TaxID=258253 RepID=A0AA43QPW5_9LECA|nr:hypothetical protein [Ramalina farinacea]